MKRSILFLAMSLAVLPLRAATNVSGNIGSNQTWTPSGNPYILTGDVTVSGANNPILKIEAGVVVKANAGARLTVNSPNKGTLLVYGNEASPVLFTSNGTATRGFWSGLYFGNSPEARESSIDHAVIEYAGSTSPLRGGVTTTADYLSLDQVTVRENLSAGILVNGGDFHIAYSEISSNGGPGINAAGGSVLRFSSVRFLNNSGVAATAPAAMLLQSRGQNVATGNAAGGNGLEIRGGTINSSMEWFLLGADFPYLVSGSVAVRALNASASVPVLTIRAGARVRFRSGAELLISHNERGALKVEGTAQAPVLFSSDGPATPGHWKGIGFAVSGTAGVSPPSKISYATIEYAGSTNFGRAGVDIRAGSVTLDHVTVRNSVVRGVSLSAGSLTVNDSVISTNSGPGVHVSSGTLTLVGNTFTNNQDYAVSLPPSVALASGSGGNSATGNGTGGNNQDAIEYRTGTINGSMTWLRAGSALPYVVSGLMRVRAPDASASIPVLTIAPGNTIKFNQNAELLINDQERGVLQANGTATEPILFTANGSASPGFWRGIGFGIDAAAGVSPPSKISYATIEYAGSSNFGRAGVDVRSNSSVTLDRVTVRNSQVRGVSLATGSLTVTDSTITANSGPGAYVSSGTLTLLRNTFTNNQGHAVSLPASIALASESSGNSATGNGTGGNNQDAIEYRTGTINGSMTWPRAGNALPYVVSGLLRVRAANASASIPVLTIAPGNTIKFNQNAELLINDQERGVLQANGTATEPILFTANGSASPGFWRGIGFGIDAAAGVSPPSKISYATIEYAGSVNFGRAGIDVRSSSSVTLDRVTVRSNVVSGVFQNGGALTLTDSTISGNTGPGMRVTGGTALSVDRVHLTGNSGNAIDIAPAFPLLAVGNLTATDNAAGGNAICISAGKIRTNTTWPVSTLPYVVTGTVEVNDPASPVLTIPPGSVIRFNSAIELQVLQGSLRAEGTVASPILFTSNGVAGPGLWRGIRVASAVGAPSRISYATVEYAGDTNGLRGGITVELQSPELDHLVLRNNLYAGLAAEGSGTPRISNSQFIGNPVGIRTRDSAKVQATLNYWGSPDGPCPAPCNVAQFLSPALSYEPWLVAAPSDPLFLASATHKNPTFNPVIGTQSFVDYSTSMSAQVTISIRNAAGQVVRTLSQSQSPGSISWNGKDESGATQPNGTYKYDIETTAPSQPPATVARGVTVIDSSRLLTLSNHAVTQLFFSPNGDAVQDDVTVSAVSNFEDTTWNFSVLDASNNVVRTQAGAGLAFAFAWNGRDGASAMQPDGVYKLRVEASVGVAPAGASVTKDASTTLDNTLPVAVITTPTAGLISNVHTSGGLTTMTPTGTVSDLNLKNWELAVGTGTAPPPGTWFPIEWSNQPVTNGALILANGERHDGPWNTADQSGVRTLILSVFDHAGNRTEARVSPLDFQHFSATQNNVHEFNAVAGGTLKYISTIPTLPSRVTESIVIRNLEGVVVRQLLPPTVRNPGTHNDLFNGRDDAGELLPDGPYFYVATVTSGAGTLVWDQSNVLRWGQIAHTNELGIQAYDPFNNRPLTFEYFFHQPARVSVGTSTVGGAFVGNCDAPNDTFFCPANKIWQESGAHSYTWWGVDHTGSYRAIREIGIVSITNEANPFPVNAAILFGSKPKLQQVKVFPPVFGPEVGTQRVEFDLTTLNSAPASVKVELVNLETKSTLRTIVDKQAAGHGVIEWDGRADSGKYVAPGYYNVIVTVTDEIGNVVRSGILTEIQY